MLYETGAAGAHDKRGPPDDVAVMGDICLPVRYDGLTETDLQAHLRYCASIESHGLRAEILLCNAGIVVPLVRANYRIKRPTLNLLIRSGSFPRDQLLRLHDELSSRAYKLKIAHTRKRNLLSRIVVQLPVDDGFVAVNAANVLKLLSEAIGLSWPCDVAIGYPLGSESPMLPGKISFRQPFRNAGYQIGLAIGKLVRKTIS
jgi:hypothetical protein